MEHESVVIRALGTVTKELVLGQQDFKISGRVETRQTTALLRSARIQRKSKKIEQTCFHSVSIGNHQLTLMWKTLKRVK